MLSGGSIIKHEELKKIAALALHSMHMKLDAHLHLLQKD